MTNTYKTIVVGSDHGGLATKNIVITTLAKAGYTVVDVGGFNPTISDDYPDYAHEVAKAVASDTARKTAGILICGTGTGMAIAANRHKNVRAALVYDPYSATMARHDNDANIACLRGRKFPPKKAAQLALLFIKTPFSKIPRHARRIQKLERGRA